MNLKIAFSADDVYVPFLATAIASILVNSDKSDTFTFFIINDGIGEENKNKLRQLKTIKDFEAHFLTFEHDVVSQFPLISGTLFSRPMYFRFFLPEYLPDVDKILYLDADIVAQCSLADLYSMDLGSNIIGAVTHYYRYYATNQRLGFPPDTRTFNSGVMLFNLLKMRKFKITEKLIKTTLQISANLAYPDQDVLNYFFRHQYAEIPPEWNVMLHERVRSYIERAKILHFSSTNKFAHPESAKLYEYLAYTEFQEFKMIKVP